MASCFAAWQNVWLHGYVFLAAWLRFWLHGYVSSLLTQQAKPGYGSGTPGFHYKGH